MMRKVLYGLAAVTFFGALLFAATKPRAPNIGRAPNIDIFEGVESITVHCSGPTKEQCWSATKMKEAKPGF